MRGAPAIFQEHELLRDTQDGAIWPFSLPDRKPAHFHGQIEFVSVRRGWAVERIGRATHRVHAGQLIWHLPGVEHEMLESSSDLDLRVVHVEPDLAAELCAAHSEEPRHAFSGWVQKLGWLAAGRPVIELGSSTRDAIANASEETSRAPSSSAAMRERLKVALGHAWQATEREHDRSRACSLVELACCLLLERPELERPALCRALDVSEGYLSRRFQAELGISFLEQRARLRVTRFIAHVARDRMTFLDAALQAGFGSYSQLYRVFTALVGMTPREYFDGEARNARGKINGSNARSDV